MKERATHHSILKTSIALTLIALLSKIIGFARESLIAAYYGATAETDAFFFAYSMPGMIFPAVCSSLSTAFISLYVKHLEEDGKVLGDQYASRMLNATVLLGLFLSALGVILSPVIVPLLAPGFTAEQDLLAIRLSRMSMGAFVFLMLQYMLTAILNSKQRFIGAQLAALSYSISIVVITVFLGPGQSMDTLMLTVIGGMLIQAMALALSCIGHFHWTISLSPFHHETRHLIQLALPILLGNSVVQLNEIVDKALGSTLPEGSLSALNYGNTLSALVITVFITSLSTVLYPTLTSNAATGNLEQYGRTLLKSMSGLSLILVPITVITLLTSEDIVEFVYARGAFDHLAVEYTSIVLACYAPMFVFSGIREVLTRGFFALQDTRSPMWNSSIGVGCNIVFSLLFVRWIGIAGIALGTTVSALVTAVLLLWNTHRKLPFLSLRPFFRNFIKQMIAGAAAFFTLLCFRQYIFLPYALFRFAVATAVGFAVYAIVLLLLYGSNLKTEYLGK